jgi:hypothetical protein
MKCKSRYGWIIVVVICFEKSPIPENIPEIKLELGSWGFCGTFL